MGCPLGTYPYKVVRYSSVCIKQGIAKGGLEWTPDSPGSQYGHFEYSNIQVVCLQSATTSVEVIECLPLGVSRLEPV
jgi:hypothetical protein